MKLATFGPAACILAFLSFPLACGDEQQATTSPDTTSAGTGGTESGSTNASASGGSATGMGGGGIGGAGGVGGSGGMVVGDWPNEPAGAIVVIDEAFDAKMLSPQPGGNWTYSGAWSSDEVVIHESAGPFSPVNAARWLWPAGTQGGDSPGRAVNSSSPAYETYYIGAWVRWSVPWTDHSSGVNKVFYWGESAAKAEGKQVSQFYVNRRQDRIDITLQWAQNNGQRNIPTNEPRLAATDVGDGEWHLLEVVANASTDGLENGRIRLWVDTILQFDVGDVRFAPTGTALFYGINLDPVWGGTGNTKPQQEWLELDHIHCSGL